MSETNKSKAPFASLGRQLKNMRMSRRQTLAEVSGAVEITLELLSAIESGAERPNEEILLLLMSHFGIRDEEADGLWHLAGYDSETDAKPTNAVSPEDMRIVYTDMLHVTVNGFGVVMNFMQHNGEQSAAVARVGMSREHALSVLELLQKALIAKPQASLPAPKPPIDSKES